MPKSDPLEILADVESLRAITKGAKTKVMASLLERLGDGFTSLGWMKPKGGPPIPRVMESESGIAFNLVPGGTLVAGPSPRMRKLLEARRKKKNASEEEVSFLDAILERSAGKRRVPIAPFLISWEPLDAETAQSLLTDSALGNVTGAPALLPRAAVPALVRASGFSLPTEDEWEWAYRACMDTLFFWGDEAPTPDRFSTANAFGVKGMGGWPEICAGPDGKPAFARGGAAPLFPYQGLGEDLLALGIYGEKAPERVAVRFVSRLDEAVAPKPKAPPKAAAPASTKATSLKVALRNPSSVTELVLREAGLRKLPPEVAKLVELVVLDLRGNMITELPASLASLTKLEVLDLTATDVTKVSKELGRLPLRTLAISGFRWKKVPADLDVLFRLPTLVELTIQSTKLSVPDALVDHPSLETLNLWLCTLPDFPQIASKIPKLRKLVLSSSKFGELPNKVRGFENLRSLDLSSTGIRKVPRAFCELPLTELDIGENEDIELDDDLLRLTRLERLVFNNVYKPLSPVLGKLANLRHLVVSNNSCPGRVAPSFLAGLASLEVLDVSNNVDLEEIPNEVLALPKLKKLVCFNSPIAKSKQMKAIRERFPHLEIA